MKIKNSWEGMSIKIKNAGLMDKSGEIVGNPAPGIPVIEGGEIHIGGMIYECELSVEEMAQGLKNTREILELINEFIPKLKKTIDESFDDSDFQKWMMMDSEEKQAIKDALKKKAEGGDQ